MVKLLALLVSMAVLIPCREYSGMNFMEQPDTVGFALVKRNFELLKQKVAEAKAVGIDTKYEDITIKTAGLFLDTYIPWDIAHPSELEASFSRWSRKDDLKGTPGEESLRAPVWEMNQTSEIIGGALSNLKSVMKDPRRRRAIPVINTDNLTVRDGFLNSGETPAFSGGFIWAPAEIDHDYFGYIGGESWLPFGTLQSDGTLSDEAINNILSKLTSLKKIGQKGSISFGQSIPAWAVAKWPDIDDYKGHFFSYDIDHPAVKGMWESFISSLVPRIKDHSAKFDYQLAIEPIWPSVGDWMVNNASPYTFKKYQTWLLELYGNMDALNISWGTRYKDFGEITVRPVDNKNPTSWYDWCRFNEWRVTDFFKFISDEIHKYDPAAKCHMRISVSGINQGQTGKNTITGLHNGIDREALVKLYEINGLDNFMEAASGRTSRQHSLYNDKAYATRWLGHTMLLDFIRSLGPDKLIYDSEWHSVSSVYYVNPEPPAGYMHSALWIGALHGLGATRTWYWCRGANGSIGRSAEEFYGSLLVQPRLLNEYGVGLAELNAFGKEVVALERVPKQIYILYSESSAIQSIEYLDHQMAAYEALQFTGLPVGFVTENSLVSEGLPQSCKWLIIPDNSHVNAATLKWLSDYAGSGGKLLIIGDNALKYNQYGKAFSPADRNFISSLSRISVTPADQLIEAIEKEMLKTGITRDIRCFTNNSRSSFGIMCRSAELKGKKLISLINVTPDTLEVSLEVNGKVIRRMRDLFTNQNVKAQTMSIRPLEVKLLEVQ